MKRGKILVGAIVALSFTLAKNGGCRFGPDMYLLGPDFTVHKNPTTQDFAALSQLKFCPYSGFSSLQNDTCLFESYDFFAPEFADSSTIYSLFRFEHLRGVTREQRCLANVFEERDRIVQLFNADVQCDSSLKLNLPTFTFSCNGIPFLELRGDSTWFSCEGIAVPFDLAQALKKPVRFSREY